MIKRVLMALVVMMTALSAASSIQSADVAEQDALRRASQIGIPFVIPENEQLRDPRTVGSAIEAAARAAGVNVLRQSFGFDDAKRPISHLYWLQNGPTELDQAFRLASGRWPTADETRSDRVLLASGSERSETTGRIADIWQNDRVTVSGLRAAFESLPLAGTYRAEGTHASQFLEELSRELNNALGAHVVSANELRPANEATLAGGSDQSFLALAVFAAIAATVILALYRQVAETKRVGVLAMHGYGVFKIWLQVTFLPVVAASSATIAVAIILGALIPGISPGALMQASANAGLASVAVVIPCLAAMSLMHRMRISEAIKNRRHSRLLSTFGIASKSAFAVVLIVALAGIGSEYTNYAEQREALTFWAKTADYAVFAPRLVGSDLADIAAGTDSGSVREAKELYDILNPRGALYVQSRQFVDPEPGEIVEDADYAYRAIMVNPNFLNEFPIRDAQGRSITIREDTQEWIVLAPDTLRPDEDKLLAHFQELRTGTDGESGMVGDTDMSGNPVPAHLRTQKVSIRFYPSGQEVFSFSPNAGREQGYMLADPIVEVMTRGNSTIDDRAGTMTGGPDAGLKVKLQGGDTRKTLESLVPILKKLHLDDNLRSLQTMTDYAKGELGFSQEGMRITAIIAAFLLMGLVGLSLQSIVLLFDGFARKTTVRRLFGYAFARRHRELVVIMSITTSLQLCSAFLLGTTRVTFFSQIAPEPSQIAISSIVVLGVEAIMVWLFLSRLETRRTAVVLKGEF